MFGELTPLDALLEDQKVVATGLTLKHTDSWHLQLEDLPSTASTSASRGTVEEPQLDLLDHQCGPKERAAQPWRRAASPSREAQRSGELARRDIPVKAPPHSRPQPSRIGSAPLAATNQDGRPGP